MNRRLSTTNPAAPDTIVESALMSKIFWRIVPFVFFLYILAYLDRVNVSFAALQMREDLQFSDAVYGFGSGIFFVGYFLFEVPSNLILERVGARVWIARIMITWGILSALTMFVNTPREFYVVRFLLGIAEAGFFPGMLLYFTYWFPPEIHARIISFFMTALAVSGIVGPPVSGLLLTMHGIGGLAGWQWLFLLEGLPSMAAGVLVLRVMQDRPDTASWLSQEEKEWLNLRLRPEKKESGHYGLGVLRLRIVWFFAAVYFCIALALNGLNFWLPQLVADRVETSLANVGLLSAIPYVAATGCMVFWGMRSDKKTERRLHVVGAASFGALGLVVCALSTTGVTTLTGLCMAVGGTFASLGPFWAMPSATLPKTTVAAGLALINSVGNLGGFFGPYLVGILKLQFGGYKPGLLLLACSLLVVVLLAFIRRSTNAWSATSGRQ
jgi:MFS transporter, ACS family, tartrate transporter